METPTERAAVIVGVDFTPSAEAALAWAADEAALRRLPLHMVHTIAEPPLDYRTTDLDELWAPWHAAVHTACTRELQSLRHRVLQRHPDLTVAAELADGPPADVLSKRAQGSAMVVVGSRQLGTVRDVFTRGAVAMPLVAHAPCPVAVVRGCEPAEHEPSDLVVVGVDDSEASMPAVEFAFEEAAFRDAHLLALAAGLLGRAGPRRRTAVAAGAGGGHCGLAGEVPASPPAARAGTRASGPSAHRGGCRRDGTGGRHPRAGRIPRTAARLGQPGRHAPRPVPGRRTPSRRTGMSCMIMTGPKATWRIFLAPCSLPAPLFGARG
jgi:nucleotide-binding universal stress UspA family protein